MAKTKNLVCLLFLLLFLATGALLGNCGLDESKTGTASDLDEIAASDEINLNCAKLTIVSGSIGLQQDVAALAKQELIGTDNAWRKYIQFLPNTEAICEFPVPDGVTDAKISNLSLRVNYFGPNRNEMRWSFELYNAAKSVWVPVTQNSFALDNVWSFAAINLPLSNEIISNGIIKVRYLTTSSKHYSLLDKWGLRATIGEPFTCVPLCSPTVCDVADGCGSVCPPCQIVCPEGYYITGSQCVKDGHVMCAASIPIEANKVANFLASLTQSSGAMPDEPGSNICNEDSNMQYALIGLAHAYACLGDQKYLDAFTRGTEWLAAREDMSNTKWRGSFRYAYSTKSPYPPLVISPGGGVTDVRGVDATSGLFVYLLFLHKKITGNDVLVNKYAQNARAALDFVLTNNWGKDGFSLSSWQLINGTWKRWNYEYTADQMDVYLGMAAGGALYDYADRRYQKAADFLKANVPAAFYLTAKKRYAVGRDIGSPGDTDLDGFDGIFPQGYLPWILGKNTQDLAAFRWLKSGVKSDGGLAFSSTRKYSLSAAMYILAAVSLGETPPSATLQWLRTVPFDKKTGGIRDTSSSNSGLISNVSGFSLMALLGTPPLLP